MEGNWAAIKAGSKAASLKERRNIYVNVFNADNFKAVETPQASVKNKNYITAPESVHPLFEIIAESTFKQSSSVRRNQRESSKMFA